MKKFLFITKNFLPQVGGGLRRIEAIYNLLLNNKNIRLQVVTASKPNDNKYKNVKYIKQLFFKDNDTSKNVNYSNSKCKIQLIDKAFLGWLPNILRNIVFKKYDFVFASAPVFSNIIAGFIYKKLRFNKPKLIIEYRDFFSFNPSYIESFKKSILKVFEKWILKNSDFIIVTTKSMENILKKFVDSKKIFLVRNYISNSDVNIVDKIEKIKFNKTYYHIGYVGKLNTGRNPGKILDMLNHKIKDKEVAIHFVGTSIIEEKSIINLAKEMELNTNRLFFEGIVNRNKSLQYMKSFDGVLLILNNDVLVKDGYGVPGKLYDYIYANNNIFSDTKTFENIKVEFDCKIKNKFDNFINFSIKLNDTLDPVFNKVLNQCMCQNH
ncbi:MAG: hypothetical protein KAT05_13840 [Spirochaetes bacterium]|nr:hypothetical protein [Spirochaetota bacterium]